MLLHASRKNVIARVELFGAAYMTVLGVQNACNVCRRQPKLQEAMLQSCYDRFGGLSKLTKGWTGVYMADGGGRMRARTAMLEISWLPRSLEGADALFWPANVYFSWVARFFLRLGPRAHLVFYVSIHCRLKQG